MANIYVYAFIYFVFIYAYDKLRHLFYRDLYLSFLYPFSNLMEKMDQKMHCVSVLLLPESSWAPTAPQVRYLQNIPATRFEVFSTRESRSASPIWLSSHCQRPAVNPSPPQLKRLVSCVCAGGKGQWKILPTHWTTSDPLICS